MSQKCSAQKHKMRRNTDIMQNDPGRREREYHTGTLLKRFVSYYKPYKKTLIMDLLCAALTTVCDLVLPRCKRAVCVRDGRVL